MTHVQRTKLLARLGAILRPKVADLGSPGALALEQQRALSLGEGARVGALLVLVQQQLRQLADDDDAWGRLTSIERP